MKYNKILKQLALKENVSASQIEDEMQTAIKCAGLDCSVKEFIKIASTLIAQKTIYSNLV